MITKLVNRYYCEHCKKGGCNAGHIRKHESVCLHNPKRQCAMCEDKGRDYAALAAKLDGKDIDWLRSEVDGCPTCMLAVLTQYIKTSADPLETASWCYENFDYRQERDEYILRELREVY